MDPQKKKENSIIYFYELVTKTGMPSYCLLRDLLYDKRSVASGEVVCVDGRDWCQNLHVKIYIYVL